MKGKASEGDLKIAWSYQGRANISLVQRDDFVSQSLGSNFGRIKKNNLGPLAVLEDYWKSNNNTLL